MRKTLLLLATILALAACDDERSNSGYPVYFSCDASQYPYSNINGYGDFIIITRSGVGAYTVRYNEGGKESQKKENLTAQQLQQSTFHYGLGGLIIGKPSAFDNNRWAFDLACPNCDLHSAKLTVNLTEGYTHAHCTRCSCKYDLNSGGIPIEGNSRPLWRYRVNEGIPPYIVVTN